MPANLTPDYLAAERKFREAVTLEDKLAALEEMLATIPKHKGTDKMQADIKRRIARTKEEMRRRPATARRKAMYHVDREGAGQVVLVGPPNSGKSQLLATLTNATPQVADYPFTTREPLPGMMPFENVQVQLVDLPPLAPDFTSPWMLGLVRAADAVLLVVDLSSDDVLAQVESTLGILEAGKIRLSPRRGDDASTKKALVAANKADVPGATDHFGLVEEVCGDLPLLPVSARTGLNLEELRRQLFELLDVIRVYTRAPGKKPDLKRPYVLKKGTTVIEAAATVHKDIARNLRAARVWGRRTFEDGQAVPRDYVLEDGDIVQFQT